MSTILPSGEKLVIKKYIESAKEDLEADRIPFKVSMEFPDDIEQWYRLYIRDSSNCIQVLNIPASERNKERLEELLNKEIEYKDLYKSFKS